MDKKTVIRKYWDGYYVAIDFGASSFCCYMLKMYIEESICKFYGGSPELFLESATEEHVAIRHCFNCGSKIHVIENVVEKVDRSIKMKARLALSEGVAIIEGFSISEFCCEELKGDYHRGKWFSKGGMDEFCEDVKRAGCKYCGCSSIKID